MKLKIIFAAILIFLFSALPAEAQSKKFGIGFIVGEPTGLSAKLWISGNNALEFGLGWSAWGGKHDGYYDSFSYTHLHIDYLWHSFNAISSNGQFPLFYGIGGRIITGTNYKGSFGVRGIFGVAWVPKSAPVDVFLEVVPTLQLVNTTGLGIDAAIGGRIYF